MKFTRNKTPPVVTPPDTFTLELSLDEMIFLKSVCVSTIPPAITSGALAPDGIDAAKRFANLIPEAPWSWSDIDNLFEPDVKS